MSVISITYSLCATIIYFSLDRTVITAMNERRSRLRFLVGLDSIKSESIVQKMKLEMSSAIRYQIFFERQTNYAISS